VIRNPTREELRLKRLMQFWTLLFALGAVVFLFFGNWMFDLGNRTGSKLFGLPPMPEPVGERFWLTLTTSLMVLLTALAYYIQKDVVANKRLTSLVLISKLTSTLTFLGFYLIEDRYFNYLLGSVFCDGPIFVVTFIFYRRALRVQAD
jgi:hypothetical protein